MFSQKYFVAANCSCPFSRRYFIFFGDHFTLAFIRDRNRRKTQAPGFGYFKAKASCREHTGCLFSYCFRIFSISLERFFTRFFAILSLSLSLLQQITEEHFKKGENRENLIFSMVFNRSSLNFCLDVRVCLLHQVNELR